MSEARISAVVVALLAGAGIALMMGQAYRNIWTGIAIAAPIALVLAIGMALIASDGVKKNKDKSSKDKLAKGD